MAKEIRTGAVWETVRENNMNPDSNTVVYGTLYRYPVFTEVRPGETVKDGWGNGHTAPVEPGIYTLYQYVQDATLMGFSWEKSN